MSTSIAAPAGAHWDYSEVKTARGTVSLGTVPLLEWDTWEGALEFYGPADFQSIVLGGSLRVAFQSIARRMKQAGKTDDEIAQAQIAYRPGKQTVGRTTPKSRARKGAEAAAEKVGGDVVARLLERIANGEISPDDAAALAG